MSLDGRFIHFLAQELHAALETGKIQKIYQLSQTAFLFMVRKSRQNLQLYLSLSTALARLHLSQMAYDKPEQPGGFCMLLRKYFEGSTLLGITSHQGDRVVEIQTRNYDDLGEEHRDCLFLEIMGRYANLVVTDQSRRIIDAYHHVSPFENQERTIEKGALYVTPITKIDPEDDRAVSRFFQDNPEPNPKQIVDAFNGISPLLANYLVAQARTMDAPVKDSFSLWLTHTPYPTMAWVNEKQRFYYFDLFDTLEKKSFPSLSELLEAYYYESGRTERIRQIAKNLLQFVKRELDKNLTKHERLLDDLAQAEKGFLHRIKGDVLLQHLHDITLGSTTFSGFSYELDAPIDIALDPLLTPIKNANLYYKKYQKSKNSVPHIQEQLTLTQAQIEYFQLIDLQLETATQRDIEEIAAELEPQGYSRKRRFLSTRKVPNLNIYLPLPDVEILLGKNNTQNTYITHTIAKPDDWWFHAKDIHGSHVLVRSEQPLTESVIRHAANLAAYFSQGRYSSSVPVDYTQKRHVRKIPGKSGSFVSYTHHKTIYIDPNLDLIDSLKLRK
jgi:predicted ribosome quality control (RQC) complex YloA/Tae2 family protein